MMGWGFGNYGGYGGVMGWIGPIMMIVFWGALIVGIVFLVRFLTRGGGGSGNPGGRESALDILKKRYAKGEMSREEFEAMRKDLRGE